MLDGRLKLTDYLHTYFRDKRVINKLSSMFNGHIKLSLKHEKRDKKPA